MGSDILSQMGVYAVGVGQGDHSGVGVDGSSGVSVDACHLGALRKRVALLEGYVVH